MAEYAFSACDTLTPSVIESPYIRIFLVFLAIGVELGLSILPSVANWILVTRRTSAGPVHLSLICGVFERYICT